MVSKQAYFVWIYILSVIIDVMDNFKCLVDHACKKLNKEDTDFYVDFIDVCENLCTELSKSLKNFEKL